jgi:ABC-type cobalamin/Fe3+-siderophores transport system ATPase subunit
MKYPRGSEWRRWDLHLHTPSSYDYDDKSVTDEDIISTLKQNSIAVVVVTDHHIIDVSRINNLRKLAGDDLTVLAGIELRSELGGSESIHFIGIFPEDSEQFSLEAAWTKLQGQFLLTPDEVKKEGDDKVYRYLDEVSDLIHNLGGIITIHAGTKSNSLENVTNSLSYKMAQKDDIAKNIDIFEMGQVSDLESYRDIVFQNIKRIYPMVICSDNHDIRNYNLKTNCWIKANPTFEGLKQIIYEPDDRVKNQEFKPEEKEMYQLIDKVKFIDDSFMPNELLINQNLTTIIGGKSTGKSILLRNIAQAIDSPEVIARLDEGDLKSYSKEVDGFKVIWKDKQESDKEFDDVNKKIIYIPQSYLNRLVEKEGKKSAIDKIIENVLRQKMGNVYDELSLFERTNKQDIANNIAYLFNLKKDWMEQKEKIKNIGDKKGVESELKMLEEQIVELKKTSGLSDSQITKYDKYMDQIKSLTSQIEVINTDKIELEKLKQESIFQEILFGNLSSGLQNEMETFYKKLKGVIVDKWKAKIDDTIVAQSENLKTKQKGLHEVKIKFSPLLERAKKVTSLNEKIKQIEIQQDKLKHIRGEEKSFEIIKTKVKETITKLETAHSKFYEKYLEGKGEILEQDVISGDLTFHLEVQHKTQFFQNDFINEVFDRRKLPNELLEYEFKGNADFSNTIKEMVREILMKELTLKGRYTEQEVLTKLLQNWYMFDYQIEQGGDSISDMSPGKKSFVLLKLLIELDSSKCPILLDQPEDDLDNRSIYDDLVKFIKNKKKERQIIVVTHNPNLVVGADAECVIVANQDVTYSENKEYQFEYILGALESTFIMMDEPKILYRQGIQEHVCEILEGGKEAFEKRRKKYGFNV